MSLEAFQLFLMSDTNSVVNIEAFDVTQDMEQPLAHYCEYCTVLSTTSLHCTEMYSMYRTIRS